MDQYIQKAVKILADDEQTHYAKSVAWQILRNAGLSDSDIQQATTAKSDDITVTVFLA